MTCLALPLHLMSVWCLLGSFWTYLISFQMNLVLWSDIFPLPTASSKIWPIVARFSGIEDFRFSFVMSQDSPRWILSFLHSMVVFRKLCSYDFCCTSSLISVVVTYHLLGWDASHCRFIILSWWLILCPHYCGQDDLVFWGVGCCLSNLCKLKCSNLPSLKPLF